MQPINFNGTYSNVRSPVRYSRPSVQSSRMVHNKFGRQTVLVEANFISRIGRIFRGFTEGVVSSMEDPEKILDQAVQDMQNDLVKMRQASAQVLASQKQLEAKYKQASDQAEDWQQRAAYALSKGQDDLAREALKRKKAYQENADKMLNQLEAQKKAADQVLGNTRMLEQKLVEAKSKKDTLKARAASAKTSKQITEMVSGLDMSTSVAAFDKMEEKVMSMESQAEAAGILAAGDDLEQKFDKLQAGSVDEELSKMKANMIAGPKPDAKRLPEGRPIKDAIDMELEELRKKVSDS